MLHALHYFFADVDKYAFDSRPTMSTRFPIARLTSIRCSPQSWRTCPLTTTSPTMSLVRGPAGSPWTVTARYEPLSLATHSAVSIPATLTKGVLIGCDGFTHSLGVASAFDTMPLPFAPRYACSSPLPPASAAGLVQPEIMFSPGTLPKRLLAGG